jgi:ribonuclease T
MTHVTSNPLALTNRFRHFLPVIIDVETGGFNAEQDALLEFAAITVTMDEQGDLYPDKEIAHHIVPFDGANLDAKALEFNKIDPFHPFRFAISETEALTDLFTQVTESMKSHHCQRAVLVGHNAWFDLAFLNAAVKRNQLAKLNPFHAFTSFDTATLSALAYGQTVLAKALSAAKIDYVAAQAHTALQDVRWTAELFCRIVNTWSELGGWPILEPNNK